MNHSRLFGKLIGRPLQIAPGNLIEVKCRDCTRSTGRPVLHRFDLLGDHVEDA